MAGYSNPCIDLSMLPEQAMASSYSGMAGMKAHAIASVIEDASVQKTNSTSIDEYAIEAPSSLTEPTNVQNTIHNPTPSVHNMTHHTDAIARCLQNTNPSASPSHEVIPTQTNLSSSPAQVPLLLTYNNSKEEACVQEPSKEIVKASIDVDGKKKLANLEFPRVLPCVGAFTVQCALCMKWRLIPTKEQYEEIRQCVLEKPFFCSSAVSWRPDASCEDPSDVSQDESHLWAIDRPNIPIAPRGWERQLVIRAAGASKFADVYYVAPSGRKLRSMPEVERFLAEFPEYVQAGVKNSQFSFIIPRPLHRNYCRKKAAGPSSPGANGSESQQLSSTNKSKKAQGSKLSVKRKAFESLSSKEGSEELFGQKKSAIVVGNSGKGPGEDYSYDSLISQQVVKGSLPPEELMKGLFWGFKVPNSGNPEQASASAASQGCLSKLNNAEVALQDQHGHENNCGETLSVRASSLGNEKNESRELVPSTTTSSLQERHTSIGS